MRVSRFPPTGPVARDAYDRLAQGYSDRSETKAENGYNEHPAIRAAIGSFKGLDVFEAGCGPGFLMRDALLGGARRVVGVDVSPAMLAIARQRLETWNDGWQVVEHDLDEPLEDWSDASFDLVASSLALDYVRDWSVPLTGFLRLLRPGGRLVVSVQHPLGAYLWFKPESAFGIQECVAEWRGFTSEPVAVPDHYRSVEEIINPLLSAGFTLERLTETRPAPELEAIDPEKFRRNSTTPTFLVIEARRP